MSATSSAEHEDDNYDTIEHDGEGRGEHHAGSLTGGWFWLRGRRIPPKVHPRDTSGSDYGGLAVSTHRGNATTSS